MDLHKRKNQKFMEEISRIRSPELFLGVARILKVQLIGEDNAPRPFEDLFADVIDAYDKAARKRRRELLEILHEANKAPEVEEDGDSAQNSD